VVVPAGVTLRVPPATGVTGPMPWSIEAEVAFCVVHVRVEVPPTWIEVGDATSVQTGAGGWTVVTVTVAAQVTVWPFASVAVPV
jgi:hypothetical protein